MFKFTLGGLEKQNDAATAWPKIAGFEQSFNGDQIFITSVKHIDSYIREKSENQQRRRNIRK